jgi:hypothetical protein
MKSPEAIRTTFRNLKANEQKSSDALLVQVGRVVTELTNLDHVLGFMFLSISARLNLPKLWAGNRHFERIAKSRLRWANVDRPSSSSQGGSIKAILGKSIRSI